MRISVVIPAYNEESYLPDTLASLGRLTRKPDEVIVVDGNSTDRTPQIAERAGAKLLRIPKTTIGEAREQGLLHASGDVVATTDADTIVPRLWLARIEESIAPTHVVAVYSGYRVGDGWFPYRFTVNVIHPPFFSLSRFWTRPIAPGQNTAYKRDAAIRVGGYPVDFQSAEDIEIVYRLKKVGTVVYRKDNYVTSSGRRGDEGIRLFFRMAKGLWLYYTTGSATTFSFPAIRTRHRAKTSLT